MKIIKKIKKVIISVVMAIFLWPKNIFAFEALYGPPELMKEPTCIELIWRMVRTYILPILFFIIFIIGSIIFFRKSKGTIKEKIITLILIFFIIVILIAVGWGIYYVIINIT